MKSKLQQDGTRMAIKHQTLETGAPIVLEIMALSDLDRLSVSCTREKDQGSEAMLEGIQNKRLQTENAKPAVTHRVDDNKQCEREHNSPREERATTTNRRGNIEAKEEQAESVPRR